MTPKNFFTYLQTFIKGLVWTGTTTKIFGDNVYFVPDTPIEHLSRFQNPSCFILDTGATMHSEHPNLIYQTFTLMVFVENLNSAWGEGVLMSANRVINTSSGAGLIDIESELIPALIKTITLNSSKISIVEKNKVKQSVISGNKPNATRVWGFETILTLI